MPDILPGPNLTTTFRFLKLSSVVQSGTESRWSLVSKVSTNHLHPEDPERGSSSLTERRGQNQGNAHYRRSGRYN